ncbi:MAG: GspH/FimT family pseudopilin [Burkholderiales bacterium]|nr:GspH/FimT family pseudopilin [Burkholderiales bacterium]
MRTRGTGAARGRLTRMRRSKAAGFTLIEILVVLVIIAIIVTLAAVHFGPSDADRVQTEADRLSLLLESARDEAIAGGVTLGWSPDGQGAYRFWRQDASGNWMALDDNDALRPRSLPDSMHLADVKVNLAPLGIEGKLVFTPSGVNSPFSLSVGMGEVSRRLSADPLGRITIDPPKP